MQLKEIYNGEIFYSIMKLLHQEYGHTYSNERIKAELQDLIDKKIILCCFFDNEEIIGHISYKRPESTDKVCSVVSVFINQEYRNKGLGKLMMTEFEFYAKKLKFKQIMLGARRGREGFYYSCGFSGEALIQYKKEYFKKEFIENILVEKNISKYKYVYQDNLYHKFYFDAKCVNVLYPIIDKMADKIELIIIFSKILKN